MPSASRIVIEMAVVGIGLAVLGLLVSYAMDLMYKRKVVWWPEHGTEMVFGTIATGALFHLICEITGVNKWYVDNYNK